MNNRYPNPWNFSNTDKNMLSPNGKYRVEFNKLYEIAMGGLIGGECYLIYEDKKIKISDFCGGPIIWNEDSNKIALPIWTNKRSQKISVVDISNLTITTFKKEFMVILFDKFIGNKLFGIVSSTYRTKEINFDINNEEIEIIKQL